MADGRGDETESRGADGGATSAARCVFCRIANKEDQADIVHEDDDYICFRDRSPAATHHYLLIPRKHIRSPGELSRDDIPLVERMGELARQVLSQQGADVDNARLGFHWPPFILVRHLHLHILSPPSSLGWFSRYVLFRENSFAFVTHAAMLERLQAML